MSDQAAFVNPEHRKVVETYFDAVLRPDARTQLEALCHANVQFHEVMGDFVGLAGFDSELLTRPRTQIPGLRIELRQFLGDATECAVRWQMNGRYPAPADAAASAGGARTATAASTPTELCTEGTTWFRFDGALIAEVWTYWDGALLFEALGGAHATP